MTRVWRFVLMCLLGVALPIQGFAAYGMAGCGSGHHGAPLFRAEQGHHDDVASGHGHDHAHGLSLADSSPHEHSHGNPFKPDKCSACASCCSAMALVSLPAVPPSIALTDHFAPLETSGVAVFLNEGLERPPRIVLA